MPSRALPPGPETRIRRREARRRARDWKTWGVLLALLAAVQLSGGIVGHFWPKAHGAEYVLTRLVAAGVLGGAIGAVLVAAAVILAGAVRGRRKLQP